MRVSKQPHERRAELMAAARQLFDEKGVGRTRVSDIVSRVGVAQGVFYYYFPSKGAIVEEVARQVTAEVEAEAGAILADEDAGFAQKLAGLVELGLNLVDQFLADDATRLDLAEDEKVPAAPALQGFLQVRGALCTLVEQAAEAGQAATRYPRQTVDLLIWGLRGLAAQALPTRDMVYALVEQCLGLPPGAVARYVPGAGAAGA